jgi:hypothetical protein
LLEQADAGVVITVALMISVVSVAAFTNNFMGFIPYPETLI